MRAQHCRTRSDGKLRNDGRQGPQNTFALILLANTGLKYELKN